MRNFIICFYIISLFLSTYGQSESEKSKQSAFLKLESPSEIKKKFAAESDKLAKKKAADQDKKNEVEEDEPEQKYKTEVQVNTNYEVLTKNLGTWKSMTINLRHDFSRRKVLYGSYQKVYRASLGSDSATIGFYQPLSKKHSLLLEMSTSPTSQFLPKWSGLAQIESKVNATTFISTGYRHTIYKDATVHIVNSGIEKYWKSYRFFYNASIAGAKGSGISLSNRFQVDKYYGKHSSLISTDVSIGNEIQTIFTANSVLKSSVQSVGFGGKHWVNSRFGLNWKALFTRQGEFYSRGGTSFGVIFRF